MNLMDRYIMGHVLRSIVLVLLVIIGLDCLMAFLDQLSNLNDFYTLSGAMSYVAWTFPRRVYEFIPMSSLVGAMLGLGMLASHSELTVMRAAGFSTARILLAVFKPVALLALGGILLGQYIAPITEQRAQSVRAVAMAGGGMVFSRAGLWHKEGSLFIHINAVESGAKLHGVTRYLFDDNKQLRESSFAQSAEYQPEGYWLLRSVEHSFLSDQDVRSESRLQERWDSGLTPELLSVVVVEPQDLSITGLYEYSQYLEAQGVNADTYQLAFWAKLLQPLSIGALVLIGVSFIFGPLRSVSVGQRIITGVVLGLVFKFGQDLLGPASSVFGFPPLLATLLPILISVAVGSLLLKRAG
ncbi:MULTISPECIES: LPS export ABC transporter permease LptG [Nitrincola]|uniref:Lipopolysaccharide export system permease protein lptG n=1 Tax=Nitrincola nitratireducens TaxID=1229521 RepID=W9VNR6_9GAMM|nr:MULTISPECIES: LPS export ABC transporter permease LptG [Nitrincola]EXJ12125.1 Lipopolysaccharide export system permease protein lptG [Nitrincola nitratireducens]